MGLAALALGASIAGTVVSTAGAISSANATADMDAYRAHVADINAQINQGNANRSQAAAYSNEEKRGLDARAKQGAIIAAQGANGVVGESTQDVRDSAKLLASSDAATRRAEALQQYYGYEVKGAGLQAEASADRAAGANAQTSGMLSAAGSALSGASSAANNAYRMWQAGGTSPTGISTGTATPSPTTTSFFSS